MMYFVYSVIFSAWVIVMMPYFLYRAWRHKKYLPSLNQRLGRLPQTLKSDGQPVIWFHSCSVGETLSVQPLADALHQRFPEARFVFSTITQGGQAIAQERFAKYGDGRTFYFPIDLPFIANRVLDWIKPTMLVTIDTEIWPNVLHECHRRHIPVVMANGRLSPESFPYYQMARSWMGQVFQNYKLLMMKSPEDAERAQRLGAPPSKLRISGNIKFDKGTSEKEISQVQYQALDNALHLTDSNAQLIVAGSTHEDEEKTLFDTLHLIRKAPGLEATRILIAPRHAERFAAVAEQAKQRGFKVQRRSQASDSEADVMVLDTYGELATAYQFATVVFVGGTLIPHGGQSIMEPALYAKPIVVGPSMQNFGVAEFVERGGVAQIAATETDKEAQKAQLAEQFIRLLNDENARTAMGEVARSIFERSKGATQFTVDRIAAIFEETLAQ